MPKKNDRSEHESAMSNLLPEVSLDEEKAEQTSTEERGQQQKDSSTELQNSSSTEEKNSRTKDAGNQPDREESQASANALAYQSVDQEGNHGSADSRSPAKGQQSPEMTLPVFPDGRPDLDKKLGPYVSDEVDEALEEVYLLLRRRFGGKASKSLIVEAALRHSLSDCLRRGEQSEVVSWMSQILREASP